MEGQMGQNDKPSIQLNLRKAEWEELGILCELKVGKPIGKMTVSQDVGGYPVINESEDPSGYVDVWNTDNDPIGITMLGRNVGSVTWCEGRYFRGNMNFSSTIRDRDRLLNRFLYYILCSKEDELKALSNYGVTSIPSLSRQHLEKLEIPIPSLQIQKTIVSLLDNYTTNLNAYLKDIEAESNARQQQYEYYRSQLLTFEKEHAY